MHSRACGGGTETIRNMKTDATVRRGVDYGINCTVFAFITHVRRIVVLDIALGTVIKTDG